MTNPTWQIKHWSKRRVRGPLPIKPTHTRFQAFMRLLKNQWFQIRKYDVEKHKRTTSTLNRDIPSWCWYVGGPKSYYEYSYGGVAIKIYDKKGVVELLHLGDNLVTETCLFKCKLEHYYEYFFPFTAPLGLMDGDVILRIFWNLAKRGNGVF